MRLGRINERDKLALLHVKYRVRGDQGQEQSLIEVTQERGCARSQVLDHHGQLEQAFADVDRLDRDRPFEWRGNLLFIIGRYLDGNAARRGR